MPKSLTTHPIYGCLNAKLLPVDRNISQSAWEDFIPSPTGLSPQQASGQLNPTITDIEACLNDDDHPTPLWGGDATNLALVIDPSCRANWYPLDPRTQCNKMYVRVSYITATELIFVYFLRDGQNAYVLLSGTGKSMFANVLMWRLLYSAKQAHEMRAENEMIEDDENLSEVDRCMCSQHFFN